MVESSRWFFFFQAEDGIRDKLVTGVQTCALPILQRDPGGGRGAGDRLGDLPLLVLRQDLVAEGDALTTNVDRRAGNELPDRVQIGRASCRERVEISVVAVSLKKKKEAPNTTEGWM